jgi:hypothetical protein
MSSQRAVRNEGMLGGRSSCSPFGGVLFAAKSAKWLLSPDRLRALSGDSEQKRSGHFAMIALHSTL